MLDDEGRLGVPVATIFRSLAHMHCNRLGLDADAERLAYSLLTRSYETRQRVTRRRLVTTSPIADRAVARYNA